MKRGCAAGIGCTGILTVILFAVILINIIADLDLSFESFQETTKDFAFKVDTIGTVPVITSEFKWKFTTSSLGRKNYKLSFQLLEKDVNEALNYLDKISRLSAEELNVDAGFRSDKVLYTKLIWHEIYKRVYSQAYSKFDRIYRGFAEVIKIEKMNPADKIYFIISFVQCIEYKRPGGELDLLPPMGTMASKFGDCDSKALLLYILLEKAGFDCVMFWSYHYKHAMLGILINSRGSFKTYNGKNYYFVETTYPGWGIGDIDPEMKNLNLWFVDDLDGNTNQYDRSKESGTEDIKNESGRKNKAVPSTN